MNLARQTEKIYQINKIKMHNPPKYFLEISYFPILPFQNAIFAKYGELLGIFWQRQRR